MASPNAVLPLARLSLARMAYELSVPAGRELALAYAWGRVCFSSWDSCLDSVARLTAWDRWPPELRSLLYALYPAYFCFASCERLHGPGGLSSHSARRFTLLLAIACALLGLKGARAGAAQRAKVSR